MPSIFSKIINGDIPCYKIAEDEFFFAFLDINPLKPGHTLVVPKQETDYIFDIEDLALGKMMIFAKKVAIAIRKTVPCQRVGVSVIGLEVPHAHIHLIPIEFVSDINFSKTKLNLEKEVMQSLAERISKAFDTL